MLAIYQPGQVGSFSMLEAINQKIPEAVHCHGWRSRGISSSFDTTLLFDEIEFQQGQVNLIIPTRDPLDWGLSRFFFRFRKYTGFRLEDTDPSPDNLVSLFVQYFDTNEQSDWYDENVVERLDVPLYDEPFPENGYTTFETDYLKTLVIQSELEDSVKSEIIGDFLDTEIEIGRTNTSEARFYADEYNAVKEQEFPKEFLDKIYGTTYAKHFYQ